MRANRIEHRATERIARAIADGEQVDWDAERCANGELPLPVGRLRLVDQLADVHRKLHADAGPLEDSDPDATSPSPLPAVTGPLFTWGHLLAYEKIGEGSFAEVYRAFDHVLRIEVALKLWKEELGQEPRAEADFLEEARRLARIRHPHVVVVHGADSHGGRVGLWTDLLQGKTLAQCVEERGPFSAYEAALIGIDLCSALAALHGSNLVHRDVKPSNVMRVQGGQIVLMDFGSTGELFRTVKPGEPEPALTGTPLTTAPEVLLHGDAPDPSADIYSLGVLLYWLVSGHYPIAARSMSELCRKHERQEMRRLLDARPDLPPAFSAVVERALKPDPEERYSTVGEMQQALASSVGTPPPVPPRPRPRRRRMALAAAAAALVLGGTAAWLAVGIGGKLQVEADLYRSHEGVFERLTSGSAVQLGDRLFLEMRGSKEMHVYVLEEDESGQQFVLFPASTDLQNPLSPRARHRLPGRIAGQEQSWVVTSLGGREMVMIIASRQPLEEVEATILNMERASPGREIDAPRPTGPQGEVERGIGGMFDDPLSSERDSSATLIGIANHLAILASDRSGIWFRKIELESVSP